MRFRPALLTALLITPAVLLAGCGKSDSKSSSGSGSKSDAGSTSSGKLPGVQVKSGAKPTVTLAKKPFSVQKTTVQVLKSGSGKTVKQDQNVLVDYLVVDGRDGKAEDTTFGKKPVTFSANPKTVLPGIAKGLLNQHIGSRVLVGVPPADAFGSKGSQQLGVQPKDTLLFLLDIKSAHTPLPRATGTKVAPKAGLPTVKLAGNGAPTITVPKTAPSKSLVVQPLIKGKGAKVASGQTITVRYVGVLYRDGKAFDDTSWKAGAQPTQFSIGVGQVIPAWDKGLVGQPVGSQVLLVVPPADGYGKTGQAQAGIKATDTLVFAIDILDAS